MESSRISGWKAPAGWQTIRTIDAHAAGEPLRVIYDGFPGLNGTSILEKRRFTRDNFDHLRKALMWEPRGHADMYGCILTPPVSEGADFGVLFTHNEGFSTMCGHGIIAVTTVVLQTGLIPIAGPEIILGIDTPAGLVTATAQMHNGRVTKVRFRNVPSFVLMTDETVRVPGIGPVRFDIAFGGAFYAFVESEDAGVKCTPDQFGQLIEKGMAIKQTVMERFPVTHPFEPDLNFLYGTIFIGPPESRGSDSRNVCIFAEGEVDRSPTGTGVSARMALHFYKKEIGIDQPMVIESIIGSRFTGRVIDTVPFGPFKAVIPEVEGEAFITGRHEFFIDPADPFGSGFILR
jgi:proline racemase